MIAEFWIIFLIAVVVAMAFLSPPIGIRVTKEMALRFGQCYGDEVHSWSKGASVCRCGRQKLDLTNPPWEGGPASTRV